MTNSSTNVGMERSHDLQLARRRPRRASGVNYWPSLSPWAEEDSAQRLSEKILPYPAFLFCSDLPFSSNSFFDVFHGILVSWDVITGDLV